MLLNQLIDLYSLVIIAAVVVSWIDVPRDHPAVKLLRNVTEPVLAPVRGVLPQTGGIDFSPIVVLIGLQLLGRFF
jgi:YggT family protein